MKTFWRSPFLTLIILVVDSAALAVLWLGVWDLRAALNGVQIGDFTFPIINPKMFYSNALPILLVCWLMILAHFKFYSHHERIADLNRPGPIFWAVVWMTVTVVAYTVAFKTSDFGRVIIAGFGAASSLYLFGSRSLFRKAKRMAVERGHGRVRVLVVGEGDLGRETLARVHEHPDIGFKVVGFVTTGAGKTAEEIEGYPILGEIKDMIPIVQRHRVEEVFLAVAEMEENEIFRLICKIQEKSPAVCKVVANLLYVIVNRAKVDEVIDLPVIAFRNSEMFPAQLFVKRVADLIMATIILLLLSPLALLFALWIKIDSKGPVLFAHDRVGLGGRLFRMYKFRTMIENCEAYAEAPTEQTDPRVTRFGRFLRCTSLDELPQMINVLKGDMSMVGPRPEMPFIVETYNDWQATRLKVKPGVTGLWQVAGRKNLPLHDNLEYDFFYVRNQSLALDAEILLRTLPAVLLSRGAY